MTETERLATLTGLIDRLVLRSAPPDQIESVRILALIADLMIHRQQASLVETLEGRRFTGETNLELFDRLRRRHGVSATEFARSRVAVMAAKAGLLARTDLTKTEREALLERINLFR